MPEPAFEWRGDPAWRAPVARALHEVVDPESALAIDDMGLVLSADLTADVLHVRLIMTSAACPVADVIVDDVEAELDRVLPPAIRIRVEVCDDVEWTPARLSDAARQFMKW